MLLPKRFMLAAAVHLLTLASAISRASVANGQKFVTSYQGCAPGQSGNNCAKMWHVTGGPGWEGQRAEWDDARGVRMICTASCTSKSNPKVCSLIMAFHGIYSNPGDQEWLMLGYGNGGAYDESADAGGPYCISFHKSAADAWQYNCRGSDHLHLTSFIDYALEEFPIDKEAVNVHGFSSGGIQIHNMMRTHCGIESKVAVASSYGSGNVPAPPTTRATYLLVHGTQDGVVTYQNLWGDHPNEPGRKTQIISCCDQAWPNCDPTLLPGYYHLYAEGLAAAVATNRGYQGDVIGGKHPAPSGTLTLVDDNAEYCARRLRECASPYGIYPNPWNAGYTCPADPEGETDVLEYPVTVPGAGRVQVWRINTWNHDYPNRRAAPWGVTVFFLEMRRFFNANRGRNFYTGERSVSKGESNFWCGDPYWQSQPLPFTDDYWDDAMTTERCRRICLEDYQCADAFYIDFYYNGKLTKNCQVWQKHAPCRARAFASWAGTAIHWRGSTKDGLCTFPAVLQGEVFAGYSCQNGSAPGDSNDGTTEGRCVDELGGQWVRYDCKEARDYWMALPDGDDLKDLTRGWWVPKCCWEPPDFPSGGPTTVPSKVPSKVPSGAPSGDPSATPSVVPTLSSAPSSVPSTSREPSSNPSQNPTDSRILCEDEQNFKMKKKKSCEKYLKKKKKREKLCKKVDNKSGSIVKNHCAATCNNCKGRCTDDPKVKIKIKGKEYTCDSIPQKICGKIIKKKGMVREICGHKCNFCGPLFLSEGPSDVPSEGPSDVPSKIPSSGPSNAPTYQHTLLYDDVLYGRNNDKLRSLSNEFWLRMQDDGNVVLYKRKNPGPGWEVTWATKTNGYPNSRLVFQQDGNLVMYDSGNIPRWASATTNKGCVLARLQEDGKFVVLKNDGSACASFG
uniref:Bulb-type lectin domain-containing protein n=1 Tax=Corethron hystrix TaxID=216773 RepID=A0A7S1C1U9_9STRA|mmetsp:Transcript_9293/g.20547  ORF Transcript_9293/g.20547 Transcript_9293/m.20547 type:complete len:901 (+) Transcript_9293:173-2875(+)